jgi:hypothetical protein
VDKLHLPLRRERERDLNIDDVKTKNAKTGEETDAEGSICCERASRICHNDHNVNNLWMLKIFMFLAQKVISG